MSINVLPAGTVHYPAHVAATHPDRVGYRLMRFSGCRALADGAYKAIGDGSRMVAFSLWHDVTLAGSGAEGISALVEPLQEHAPTRRTEFRSEPAAGVRIVHSPMGCVGRYFQVLLAVVEFIAVNVVNYFALLKRATNFRLYDQTVFKNISAAPHAALIIWRRFYQAIAAHRDGIGTVPSWVPLTSEVMASDIALRLSSPHTELCCPAWGEVLSTATCTCNVHVSMVTHYALS